MNLYLSIDLQPWECLLQLQHSLLQTKPQDRIKSLSPCARRSFPSSLPAPGAHRLQLAAENPALPARLHCTAQQGHTDKPRAQGGEGNRAGESQSPKKVQSQSPQTPAPTRLGAGKPGCLKRLKCWQSPPAFQGAVMSADSLCKTFICRKKKAREIHCLLLSSK